MPPTTTKIERDGTTPLWVVGDVSVPAGYTVCDFIDPRIDVDAQYALYGYLNRGQQARWEALHVLAAVKAGVIQGVYAQDQRAPALLALKHQSSWWTMIPSGEQAVLFPDDDSDTPLIAFRLSLRGDRGALGAAIVKAFRGSSASETPVPIPSPSGGPCGSATTPPSVSPPPAPPAVLPPPGAPSSPNIDPDSIPDCTADPLFEVQWNSCAMISAALYYWCGRSAFPRRPAGFGPNIISTILGIIAGSERKKTCDSLPPDMADHIKACVVPAVMRQLLDRGCIPLDIGGMYDSWLQRTPR
jgi:hypothetical protein